MAIDNPEQLDEEARRCKWSGRFSEALALRQALEKRYDDLGVEPVLQAKNLNMLAYLAACRGQRSEAVRAASKCLALYKRALEPNPHHLATYVMMLSCVLAENGQFREAVVCGEEALAMFTQLHGRDNSFVQDLAEEVESMRHAEVRDYPDKGDSLGSS
jgi:tetratricopeptide (TPR) repeat protein